MLHIVIQCVVISGNEFLRRCRFLEEMPELAHVEYRPVQGFPERPARRA